MSVIKPVFFRKLFGRMKYRTYKRKRRINILLLFIFYFTLIMLASTFFEQRVMPSIMAVAESKAQYSATILVNKIITEYITKNEVQYDQFFSLEKNENGQISALISNTTNINQIKSQMMLQMQEQLNSIEDSDIRIPLLSFTGNLLLSDLGPKFPIRILTTGFVTMDIKNKFTSAGVNQTKHEVYIDCISQITMLMPGRRSQATIHSTVPLTEAIIVGVVPNTYVHLDGKPINQEAKE